MAHTEMGWRRVDRRPSSEGDKSPKNEPTNDRTLRAFEIEMRAPSTPRRTAHTRSTPNDCTTHIDMTSYLIMSGFTPDSSARRTRSNASSHLGDVGKGGQGRAGQVGAGQGWVRQHNQNEGVAFGIPDAKQDKGCTSDSHILESLMVDFRITKIDDTRSCRRRADAARSDHTR